ncbi:MAG TPA: MATE family efflux transporter [Methanotrichaceae archaeon]|nr:MATE family efflux transporter [Methanotrichaceae archaeon]
MAMMVGNLLFEIIDMFWVGHTSSEGIAAVAVSSYFIWALRGMATITSGGTNTLISRCAGARCWDRLSLWFFRGLLLAVLYSIALVAIGFLSLDQVLRFMGLESEVYLLAREFLSIFYLSLPLVFLFVFFEGTFQSLGDSVTPASIAAFSLALNAVLDPFLIFGWYGFPALGVPGAALATAIAQGVGVLLFIWRIRRENLQRPSGLLMDGVLDDLIQITRIGAPIATTGTLFSLVYIIITKIVAPFGTAQIAAMGIGQRWEGLAYFACVAASTAVATVVGQNLGLGNMKRAREAAVIAVRYLLAFTALVSLIFILGGGTLAAVLTPDIAVIEATRQYLMIIGFFEVAMALELGLEGAFIGSGNTLPPFLISVPLTLMRIPVAWFLAVNLNLGVDAVWWTISASTLLKGALMGIWFLRGRWTKTRVRI